MSPLLAFTLGALFGLLSGALWHWYAVAAMLSTSCTHCGRRPFDSVPPPDA